jgi:hypothetical protein
VLELGVNGTEGELTRHIVEYVRFVESWNKRVHRNEPADAAEFDQYSGLVKSGLWSTRHGQGDVNRIQEAPAFFVGGELSWRVE